MARRGSALRRRLRIARARLESGRRERRYRRERRRTARGATQGPARSPVLEARRPEARSARRREPARRSEPRAGRKRLSGAAGVLGRLVVLLALIAAVSVTPLLLVYRSECPGDDGVRAHWSFVAPFGDPPAECRDHRTGLRVLADELGL